LTTFDVPDRNHLESVVSLYDTELQDYGNPPINYDYSAPPYDPLQHRLIVQADSKSAGHLDRDLAAGTTMLR